MRLKNNDLLDVKVLVHLTKPSTHLTRQKNGTRSAERSTIFVFFVLINSIDIYANMFLLAD